MRRWLSAMMAEHRSRILVVDDEADLRRALEVNLSARGYLVEVVGTGEHAVEAVARELPDLVVLDLGLPGMSGVEVIGAIRAWNPVPIVVLSARESESDKVAALDAGADDYVTKPFGIDELLARIRAALRRVSAPVTADQVVEAPGFTVDLVARQVIRAGVEVRLTPTEWHMVEVLARHHGRLVPQRQLLQEVWGPEYGEESNYLRVYMAQIRRKLEVDPASPRALITEPGRGYRLVVSPDGH
jgi:two-component system KDP operon response regulator KdpE